MYETRNDLAFTARGSLVEMLNEHLADAIDLHLQAATGRFFAAPIAGARTT